MSQSLLSTQGYRGTRDFFPQDQRLRSYIYSQIHKTLQSFGYEEYGGPFVEPLELYAAKSSEEIVRDQLYSFVDRGERKLAIRPEMTPTLARMVASKQRELSKPIRWYSIPTCMRFERPQRGRLREFDQLNVDILGGVPLDEDVEILLTCISLLKGFGAKDTDFEIKINHRGIINSFFDHILKLNGSVVTSLLRLLDKRDKITQDEFVTECEKLNLNPEQIKNLEQFLILDIDGIISLLGEANSTAAVEIKQRLDIVKKIAGSNSVMFSPTIMRGFNYYTGMVFEVFDTDPSNRRAMFGGGRFDNLVGSFSGEQLSGIGYGMGDVAISNFLEVHGLLPDLKKTMDVSVVRFSEGDRIAALELSQNLRNSGLKVECSVVNSKFGKQIQSAEKSGARMVAFRGQDELSQNTFAVKWLDRGEQEIFSYTQEGFLSFLKKCEMI